MSERGVSAAVLNRAEQAPSIEELKAQLDEARRRAARLEFVRLGKASQRDLSSLSDRDRQIVEDYRQAKIAYGQLYLADVVESADSDASRNAAVTGYSIQEDARLNEEITDPTEMGVIDRARRFGRQTIGVFGNWLTTGSRKVQMAKSAAVGAAAGVVGGIAGGVLGGAVAGAFTAGARYLRGYAAGVAKEVERAEVSADQLSSDLGIDYNSLDDALTRAHELLQIEREKHIQRSQEKNYAAVKRGMGMVVVGAVVGATVGGVIHEVATASTAFADTINHDVDGSVDVSSAHDATNTVDIVGTHEGTGTVDVVELHGTTATVGVSSIHDTVSTLDISGIHDTTNTIDTSSAHDTTSSIVDISSTHDTAGTADAASSHDTTNTVDVSSTHDATSEVEITGGHDTTDAADVSDAHNTTGAVDAVNGHEVTNAADISDYHEAMGTVDVSSVHDTTNTVDVSGAHDTTNTVDVSSGHDTTGTVDGTGGGELVDASGEFTVEYGHGDTHELIDFFKANGETLSPEDAWKLHVDIIDSLHERGQGLVHGNYIVLDDHAGADAYSMGRNMYEVGISASSHDAHFTTEAQAIIEKHLAEIKGNAAADHATNTVDVAGGHNLTNTVDIPGAHDTTSTVDVSSTHDTVGGANVSGTHETASTVAVAGTHDATGTVDIASGHEVGTNAQLPSVDAGEGLNAFVHDNYGYTLSPEQSLELGQSLHNTGQVYESSYLADHAGQGNPYGISEPGMIDPGMNVQIEDMVDNGHLDVSYHLTEGDWNQIYDMLSDADMHDQLAAVSNASFMNDLGPQLQSYVYADGSPIVEMDIVSGRWSFVDNPTQTLPQQAYNVMYSYMNAHEEAVQAAQQLAKVL